ncbi:MAG TPA: type II toxin-antitoxin system MqsA family antitoxin [Myxococcota bacterium]|nr:type II toxin-antitoxin system MqsA family antitoxin [Myxococcota bacterium]HOA13695.1 type II toxin-antitoxin system MqsA family antitoxin [Myxococcota bacterium]HOD00168.1 type II toxin-antitoxin system MqsA family antitoxin [Myxococcota bacterium]HOH77722.1 type II toxin-antitoxin system MqsA family antitoxin [Myxococcota bacterium]HPV04153.1 type II toxin-antitoxin system MqsA family antitoxin [Myxococcota bacterium]
MDERTLCHECGAEMVLDTRPQEISYKGLCTTIMQRGWYCTNCSEVLLNWDEVEGSFEAFARMKAQADNLLLPKEITRIRKKLKLSQRKASAILGGGPHAFQRYESGRDWITRSMANLLRLLDNDPNRLNELLPRSEK